MAAGWGECLNEVPVQIPGPGWGAPPTGQFGPEFVIRYERCGNIYIEMSAAGPLPPLCSCGTFAIGICLECGEPACGFHSRLYDGRRLHDQHVMERKAQRERE